MIRNFYDSRQWWTYIFILVAIFIVIATVYYSNSLSKKLAEEERLKAEYWAEAMRIMATPGTLDAVDETPLSNEELTERLEEIQNTMMFFFLKITNSNQSIPVILCNENDSIVFTYNIFENESTPMILRNENDSIIYTSDIPEYDSDASLKNKLNKFKAKNPPIVIKMEDGDQYLYYDDSILLKRLTLFPYVQLSIVFAFIILSFLALISTKKAEQNKVWVGLSKETAHQLGTPISSLIAWVEYLKTKDVDGSYLKEMEKDVKRLETVADRFSKIGSKTDLLPLNINNSIKLSCEYMSTRISSKVKLDAEYSNEPVLVLMNESLFSWVTENLTKNAVDAMEGQGSINYYVINNKKKVYIDVTDTGKGISKSRFKTIFNPGYTTKKRGWGLGLSLVKRIIESYPGGKIYVKNSEIGKGTTFRIELRKYVG